MLPKCACGILGGGQWLMVRRFPACHGAQGSTGRKGFHPKASNPLPALLTPGSPAGDRGTLRGRCPLPRPVECASHGARAPGRVFSTQPEESRGRLGIISSEATELARPQCSRPQTGPLLGRAHETGSQELWSPGFNLRHHHLGNNPLLFGLYQAFHKFSSS